MPRRIRHFVNPSTGTQGVTVGGLDSGSWSAYLFIWPWLPVATWEPTKRGSLTALQKRCRADMNSLVKAAKAVDPQVVASLDPRAGLVVLRANDNEWPEIMSTVKPVVDRLGIEVRPDEVLDAR